MDPVSPQDDRFLLAWGEAEAWRGYDARAQVLASLSTPLLAFMPGVVFTVAHALGNASALRHQVLHAVDGLLPTLSSPFLHKGLSDARTSRRGPARWRRYWLNRAVAYTSSIEAELAATVTAQTRLSAFSRALIQAQAGIDHARAQVPVLPPIALQRDWTVLVGRLDEEEASLRRLDERIGRMYEGIAALQVKAASLVEVCHALPSHEDILRSASLQALVARLFELRASGLPGVPE